MSKVITFSRKFPANHPKKGQQTFFVEKIWKSLYGQDIYIDSQTEGLYNEHFPCQYIEEENIHFHHPKGHTIRAGERWKVGDKFSPRVWSGKPYKSPMVNIAADIEIKKIWTFEVDENGVPSLNGKYIDTKLEKEIARNDGLSKEDFIDWLIMPSFRSGKPFKGQLICWDERIEY